MYKSNKIEYGPNSLFPQRTWTMEWLQQHCMNRFGGGMIPDPNSVNQKYHIDQIDTILDRTGYLLFTNGLNDGWSVGGITTLPTNVSSKTVVVMNFPNGSHHSELNGIGPNEHDTDDIRKGYQDIENLLSTWLLQQQQHEAKKKEDAHR